MLYLFIAVIVNIIIMRIAFYTFLEHIGTTDLLYQHVGLFEVRRVLKDYRKLTDPDLKTLRIFRFFDRWEVIASLSLPLYPVIWFIWTAIKL